MIFLSNPRALLMALALPGLVLSDEPDMCSGYTSCSACLANEEGQFCAWTGDDNCRPTCADAPDVTCYSSEVLPDLPPLEICRLAGDCGANTNCGDCIGSGCKWVAGEFCSSSCDIADATCFDLAMADDPNSPSAVFDTCALVDNAVATPCDSLVTCEGCIGSTCAWVEETKSCVDNCQAAPADTACFSVDSTPDVSLGVCSIQVEPPMMTDPTPPPPEVAVSDNTCGAIGNCGECIDTNCVWLGDSTCASSCAVDSTVTCYSTAINEDFTTADICDLAGEPVSEIAISDNTCGAIESCGECIDTNCVWLGDSSCASSCEVDPTFTCYSTAINEDFTTADICELAGEPVPEVGVTDNTCGAIGSCGECIDTNCVWLGDSSCADSCEVDPTFTCYSTAINEDFTTADICDLAGEPVTAASPPPPPPPADDAAAEVAASPPPPPPAEEETEDEPEEAADEPEPENTQPQPLESSSAVLPKIAASVTFVLAALFVY